jgi:hypothetical protein
MTIFGNICLRLKQLRKEETFVKLLTRICRPVRSLGVLATVCIFCMQSLTAHGSTLVRGENRTCRDFADLDYALDHPSSAYFKGWTGADFDAAQTWVSSCFASPPSNQDRERQSLLAQRRGAMDASGEIHHNDESIKNQRATDFRDQQTRELEIKAHQECLRSYAYLRYMAETRILDALDRESEAQQTLDRERRIEEASGITNLYTQRYAGESLVAAQDNLDKWWVIYQQHGGAAKTPQSLSRSIANPCN